MNNDVYVYTYYNNKTILLYNENNNNDNNIVINVAPVVGTRKRTTGWLGGWASRAGRQCGARNKNVRKTTLRVQGRYE